MQGLRRLLVVGIMRAWMEFIRQDSASVPRPTGTPEAHAPGANSDRVLILGSGPASGWGVSSHDLALPGSLARALSARTGCGADVTLVADPFGSLEGLPNLLAGHALGRFQAVVVFVGVNDAVTLTSEKSWERNMGRLLRSLERDTLDSTNIYVMGIQPIRTVPVFDSLLGSVANTHARRLNVRTERVCRTVPHSVYLPLTDNAFIVSGRYLNSTDYRLWGEFLADEMAARLDLVRDRHGSNMVSPVQITAPPEVEAGVESHLRETRYDPVLALAQQSFGTESAAFVLRDHSGLRVVASVGPTGVNPARSDSMSATVVIQPGALVVGDTETDERFRGKPYVTGPPFMRFFAGFPIESPSGERIGILCVFDPKPRSRADTDIVLLRQLALIIQHELQAIRS
ncbi:GAF domain-containing protein [Cryobacterium flavum]|uniref:GAF domain-containing protein n=1 Tax=Cryobacterium flavum TaxID=1424659 RepID=A0A4R8V0I3_9MICO|nr:GAF domain-containing protein [Cryobacterium flavum]SDN79831.1 GAF domain-containing protein [Cryobacterium flavum]